MDALTDQPSPKDQQKNPATARRGQNAAPAAMLLRHLGWGIAAVLLIAFNLRPSITTVALFIADIRSDLGLSTLGISVLTMLPVICLGLFAPLAPPLARRFSIETVLTVALVGVAAGSVVRSFGVVPLFLGTVIIGASLCFLGVLSPVVVKRDFPHRVGLMMGLYTMLVCVGPALAAATAVPFRHVLGGSWELVLLIWGLPCLIGAIALIPQFFRHKGAVGGVTPAHLVGLMREPLAWQVTGYFALITALAYAVFNWGPTMLEARGLDAATSGFVMSLCYVGQTVAGLLAPIVAGRQSDQRLIIGAMVILTALGLLGFVYAPVWSLDIVALVLGVGQGGAFGVALLLFALRTRDPHSSARLSAMAQTVGYVLGGVIGPFAVGVIYDWTNSWQIVSVFYLAVGLASLLLGIGAGRARFVGARAAVS
jgi:CP family cyanate transporter-like MFS transporter